MVSADSRAILNARGTRFEVPLKNFFKYPKTTRLGQLATYLSLNSTQTLELCDEVGPAKNEFFFDRNPHVLGMVLDYYVTGELHNSNTTMCQVYVENELKYWMIDRTEMRRCCKVEYEVNLADREEEFTLEKEALQAYDDDKAEFNGLWNAEIREKLWSILQVPKSSKIAMTYFIVNNVILALWIIYNMIHTLPDIRTSIITSYANVTYQHPQVALNGYTLRVIFQVLDFVLFTYFLIDYVIRCVVCPSKKKYVFTIVRITEGLSILSFFVFFFLLVILDSVSSKTQMTMFTLYFFQHVLSTFKIIALTDITNYSWKMTFLSKTLRQSGKELFIAFFYLTISLLIVSNLMFYLEVIETRLAEAENAFDSVYRTMWWGIITMTTVGYGDMYPSGTVSKLLAAFTAIWGIILIALPVAVVGTRYSKVQVDEEKKHQVIEELKTRKKND